MATKISSNSNGVTFTFDNGYTYTLTMNKTVENQYYRGYNETTLNVTVQCNETDCTPKECNEVKCSGSQCSGTQCGNCSTINCTTATWKYCAGMYNYGVRCHCTNPGMYCACTNCACQDSDTDSDGGGGF